MCRRGIADWANDVNYGAARSDKKRENSKQVNGCNEGGCVRVGMREEDRSARLR